MPRQSIEVFSYPGSIVVFEKPMEKVSIPSQLGRAQGEPVHPPGFAPRPGTHFGAVIFVALCLMGCEEEKPTPVTRSRSEAIVAAPGTNPNPTPSPPQTEPEHAIPRGPLCNSKPGTALRQSEVGGMGTGSSPFSGGTPGKMGPVWINLWAAWCEPCKKELPILRAFKTKLAADGLPIGLDFVSIDDDPRQLQRFLDDQPPDGLKKTFWLREGTERDEWLAAAGLGEDPRLPVHLLVDGNGSVLCRIDGSVEEDDFDAVKTVFAGQ